MPDGNAFRAGLVTATFGLGVLGAWWLGLFGPIIAELSRALVTPGAASAPQAARGGAAPVASSPPSGGLPDLAPLSA